MDPRSEVNYSHFIEEAMVLMKRPSMIDAPFGGAPEQAPRWDLVDTESCSGGIRFFGSFPDHLGVRGYIWEEEVHRWSFGGPTRVGGAPPYLVPTSKLPWRRVQVSWIMFGEKITFPEVLFRLDSV